MLLLLSWLLLLLLLPPPMGSALAGRPAHVPEHAGALGASVAAERHDHGGHFTVQGRAEWPLHHGGRQHVAGRRWVAKGDVRGGRGRRAAGPGRGEAAEARA